MTNGEKSLSTQPQIKNEKTYSVKTLTKAEVLLNEKTEQLNQIYNTILGPFNKTRNLKEMQLQT